MRHLITNCYIWKMDHSLTLATSKALHELILEAGQALQILYVIIRAGWVHSGQLICPRSPQQVSAKARISLGLRYFIYKMEAKVGGLQRLGERRHVEIASS